MNTRALLEEWDTLFRERRFGEGERMMLQALADAEAEQNYGMALSICNELGGFYRVMARYEEGVQIFEKAAEFLTLLGMTDTPEAATTHLNLATLHAAADDTKAALREYERAAALYEENGVNDYRLAALYNNMASLYIRLCAYDKAEESERTAIGMLETMEHLTDEYGVSHTVLAEIYLAKGDLQAAKEAISRAGEIFSSIEKPSPFHYTAYLGTAGNLCRACKEPEKAAGYYKRAMDLTEKYSGRNKTYEELSRARAACLPEGEA